MEDNADADDADEGLGKEKREKRYAPVELLGQEKKSPRTHKYDQ